MFLHFKFHAVSSSSKKYLLDYFILRKYFDDDNLEDDFISDKIEVGGGTHNITYLN